MRRSTPRRAVTFVEVLVALFLLGLILGTSWYFFVTVSGQTKQAMDYSTVLQSATMIGARLQIDLAAAYVPAGDPLASDLFQVGADGKSLGFTRAQPAEDLTSASVKGSNRRWLEYTTQPGPNGTLVLERRFGDQVTRWPETPLKELRFRLQRANSRSFVIAEMLLVDSDTAARPDLSSRRPFALRIVKRLRDTANFRGLDGKLNDFPVEILGPLPGASTAAVSELPVGEDPGSVPLTEEGVGLEAGL